MDEMVCNDPTCVMCAGHSTHEVTADFVLTCNITGQSMAEADIPEGHDVSHCPFCNELL